MIVKSLIVLSEIALVTCIIALGAAWTTKQIYDIWFNKKEKKEKKNSKNKGGKHV